MQAFKRLVQQTLFSWGVGVRFQGVSSVRDALPPKAAVSTKPSHLCQQVTCYQDYGKRGGSGGLMSVGPKAPSMKEGRSIPGRIFK